jgi:predicted DNA-binding mobile mystery protein A
MTIKLPHLRLEQLDRALSPYAVLAGKSAPRGGWLRAIREGLGRSLRVQAQRVGIAAPTLLQSESAEAHGRISMEQLRRLANALDCELVYALIPRQPLMRSVEEQAENLARQEILGVTHSMGLEAQRPSDDFVDRQILERKQELLIGSWSRLWR